MRIWKRFTNLKFFLWIWKRFVDCKFCHGFEKDFLISIFFFFFLDLKKIWWFLIILWIWKRFVDCKFFHGFEKDLQIWNFFCRFEKDLTSSNYFVDLKKNCWFEKAIWSERILGLKTIYLFKNSCEYEKYLPIWKRLVDLKNIWFGKYILWMTLLDYCRIISYLYMK